MSEKRREPRLPILLSVVVVIRGIGRVSCMMKDVCSTGALIEISRQGEARSRDPVRGDVILIRMFLGNNGDVREHELNGRVCHVSGNKLGVAFFKPDEETLRLVLARAGSAAATAVSHSISPESRRLLAQLGRQLEDYLRGQEAEFSQQLSEELFNAAEAARNNALQRQMFDSMTSLRKARETILARLLAEVGTRLLEDSTEAGPNAAVTRQDARPRLALVDKEQFEDWLVIRIMASNAESRCTEQLFALRTRLRELNHREVRHQTLFAPITICESFQAVIAPLNLAAEAQKIIYRQFSDRMLGSLNTLYEELNATLIRHGILPELPHAQPGGEEPRRPHANGHDPAPTQPTDTPEPPATTPTAAPAGGAVDARPVVTKETAPPPRQPHGPDHWRQHAAELGRVQKRFEGSQRDARAAISALQHLFAVQKLGAVQQKVEAGEPLVSLNGNAALNGAVATVENDFGLDDVRQSLAELKAARADWRDRLDQIASERGSELGGAVQATLKLSEGVVQTLGESRLLGENARNWFAQLELPLLYSLMADNDLLQREDHPARQVFNNLARLGLRNYPLTATQERAVHKLVDRIRQEFDTDPEIFTSASKLLAPFVERQKQAYQRNLERVRQMAEGEQKQQDARQQVQARLAEAFAGKPVPPTLPMLLDNGWRDLLTNSYLRDGAESAHWHHHFDVLQRLVAVLGRTSEEPAEGLLQDITTGLHDIAGIEGAGQKATLAAIETALAQVDDTTAKAGWTSMPMADAATPDMEPAQEKWAERAQRLALGNWIELLAGTPEAERLRLAWRAGDGSRFVFVNHQGIKVRDFQLAELAALLALRSTVILSGDEAPLVDDALEKVVQNLYDKLAWSNTHDELTGLFNQHEFSRCLDRLIDTALRSPREHVLCCFSVDQFRLINTASGFEAGDAVLKTAVEVFSRDVAASTVLGRLNADLFGMLLEDCDLDTAQHLVTLKVEEVAGLRFSWAEQHHRLTVSASLVAIGRNSNTPSRMLGLAEECCEAAHAAGGNRVQRAHQDAATGQQDEHRMTWVTRLSQPLRPEHIKLRCQRIQPINPERAKQEQPHYEILLGLGEFENPHQSPGDFLEAAEQHNRMTAVDRWVVDTALQWLVDNRDRTDQLSGFSINLCGHSLSDEQTMNYLISRLMQFEYPVEKLCFEVTETSAISNLSDAADFMRELKKVGCRFALDDFGVGHSTYHYIKYLPVDYLKIDGSFVRELHKNPNDYIMVKSINELAHFMGLETVAEYVENQEILDKLAEIGVDYAQGYAIERPIWLNAVGPGPLPS